MQRPHCDCSFSNLQKIVINLSPNTISFDSILQTSSDFIGYFTIVINCKRCVTTKRMTSILSQITSRLVCFYEAAYLSSAANVVHLRSRSIGEVGLLLSPPLSQHGQPSPMPRAIQITPTCQSMFNDMRLGKLQLENHEARILAEVILVDTCLEINEKVQEWMFALDEAAEATGEQCDAAPFNCLDRLAKLIGLLQFDKLSVQTC